MKRKKIGELLLGAELITPDQLESALTIQKNSGKKLGQILIELGHVGEVHIARTLSQQLSIPLVNCHESRPPLELLDMVPRDLAVEKLLLPIEKNDKSLLVAMADPLDWQTLEDLSFRTGLKVIVAVSSKNNILNAIEHYYSFLII